VVNITYLLYHTQSTINTSILFLWYPWFCKPFGSTSRECMTNTNLLCFHHEILLPSGYVFACPKNSSWPFSLLLSVAPLLTKTRTKWVRRKLHVVLREKRFCSTCARLGISNCPSGELPKLPKLQYFPLLSSQNLQRYASSSIRNGPGLMGQDLRWSHPACF
jgi:hypothetical protein